MPGGFPGELHGSFGQRAHAFEALPEENDGETCVVEVLAHLDRALLHPGFDGSCGAWDGVAVMTQRKYPLGGCVSVRVWGGDGSQARFCAFEDGVVRRIVW